MSDIRGVGLAKMTKVLHKKRPALIPMLDSVVVAYLRAVDDIPTGHSSDVALALHRSYKVELDANLTTIQWVQRELTRCRIRPKRVSDPRSLHVGVLRGNPTRLGRGATRSAPSRTRSRSSVSISDCRYPTMDAHPRCGHWCRRRRAHTSRIAAVARCGSVGRTVTARLHCVTQATVRTTGWTVMLDACSSTLDQLQLSPSDVTAFLACEHLTTLSLAHARGELDRPEVENEQAELIFRKGLEHERAYLEHLRADGKTVLEIADPRGDYDGAARATADAIRDGEADVIYQGVFAHEHWRGVADFLLRRPDGVYEALDTKLARNAKPAYILQLLFYDEQLARIQGATDRQIHVLLGSGEQATFDPREFAAYYRRVRSRLEQFVADPPPTEPYPVDHCDVCDFKAALRRLVGRGRPPHPRRRRLPDADREARGRGDHDARPARPRARGAGAAAGSTRTRGRRTASRPSCSCTRARPARTSTGCCRSRRKPASRSCPSPRPATSSSTSRATRSGTRTARSSTSGGSSTSTATSRRCTRTTTTPSGRRSSGSSTSSTRGWTSTPTCTSTTTPPTRSRR